MRTSNPLSQKSNKSNRLLKRIPPIFIIIGVVMIIVGIVLARIDANFRATANETTAVITSIERRFAGIDERGFSEYRHTVHVSFYANDREYRVTLGHFSLSMFVGKEIPIFYDPANPQNFRSEDSTGNIVMLFLGSVFFLIGFIMWFVQFKHKSKRKRLLENGKKITAEISDIEVGNVVVNGREGRKIICEYKDATSGKIYFFKSHNIFESLPRIDKEQGALQIAVYVDNNDYSKYYVDVDDFLKGFNIVDLT